MLYFDFDSIDSAKDNFPAVNEVSWPEFIQKVNQFKKILLDQNPKRLLVKIPNTPDGAALLLTTNFIPVETIVVADYHHEELIEKIFNQYDVSHSLRIEDGMLICSASQKVNEVQLDQPYLCLLTSGTTGMPKCVKHTWKSLISRIKIDPKFKGCKWFIGYPITHFAGLQVMLQCLSNRGSLIVPPSYEPSKCISLIAEHQPEYVNCTPTLMRQLFMSNVKFDWGSSPIKRITMGGEIVEQSIINLIKNHMPNARITHIYASTELGPLITVTDEKEGFPISLIDNQFLMIKDHELWVKPSESAMLQYLKSDVLKKDEWIPTKDIVDIKGDRVIFQGRTDDIINVGGFKVLPSTVEQIIREIPGVKEVVVFGQSNPIVGHLVKAKVQADIGQDQKLLKKEIIKKCKEHLPDYMVPGIVQFVDALTVTQTHKLLRREL